MWGYAISHMRVTGTKAHVELNPTYLASVLGSTLEMMESAIEYLCDEDKNTRTSGEDGRRMVLLTKKTQGPMQFLVVNGYKYRNTRDEDARLSSNRRAQLKYAAKKKTLAAGEDWDPEKWEPEGKDSGLATAVPVEDLPF